jgi:hypothetical protein
MQAAQRFVGDPAGSTPLIDHTHALLDGVLSPDPLQQFDSPRFLEAFRSEKKHGRHSYHVIAPPREGAPIPLGVEEIQLPRESDQESAVLEAMLAVIREVGA